MNKKDYLRFYIGCKFILEVKNPHIKSESKSGVLTFDGAAYDAAMKGEIDPILLLKPLGLMSDSDKMELNMIDEDAFTEIIHNYHLTPDAILWLTQKWYDIFNIISKGYALAIVENRSYKKEEK